jgi:hypothetical protein
MTLCLAVVTAIALPSEVYAQMGAVDSHKFFLTLGIGGHSMRDSVQMEFGPHVFADFGYFISGRISVGAEFGMSGHSMSAEPTFSAGALAGHYVAELRAFVTNPARVGIYVASRAGWTSWTSQYTYETVQDTDTLTLTRDYAVHGVLVGGRVGGAVPISHGFGLEIGGTVDYAWYGDIDLEGHGLVAPDSRALQAGGFVGLQLRF